MNRGENRRVRKMSKSKVFKFSWKWDSDWVGRRSLEDFTIFFFKIGDSIAYCGEWKWYNKKVGWEPLRLAMLMLCDWDAEVPKACRGLGSPLNPTESCIKAKVGQVLPKTQQHRKKKKHVNFESSGSQSLSSIPWERVRNAYSWDPPVQLNQKLPKLGIWVFWYVLRFGSHYSKGTQEQFKQRWNWVLTLFLMGLK